MSPTSPEVLRFSSDDLDETVAFLSEGFGRHYRVPLQRGPLGYQLLAATSSRAVAGWTSVGTANVIRATVPSPTVHIALRQEIEYRVGRRVLRSAPGRAVLLAPGHDYSARIPPGKVVAMIVAPSLLDEELQARQAGRTRSLVPKSIEVELTPELARQAENLAAAQLAAVPAANGDLRHPGLRSSERRLAAWVANRLLEHSGLRALSPASRQLADDLDAWIRGHLAEPITFERLRSFAGVSSRCLQKACLARWGQTPIELVTTRRLHRARDELLARPAAASVTEVAISCGFTHLGRFAGLYRRTFGESPSDTLGR
ncbi:MAG TPA: helix-turn-helix domain-containing protein [Steroidobacteraceae bacterium]|nr:helix-turn-helix domain-containing protein [Steroidobacteraceae bacterium]